MADELSTKRIINLPAESEPTEGDMFVVDNESTGTKKLPVTGFLDPTLSKSRQAAPAKAVGDLRDDFNNSTNIFREDLTAQLLNGYIAVGTVDIGSAVDFTVQSGAVFKTNKFQCKKGDTFIISGYLNANAPRLWAFTDTQQILLSKSENKVTLDNKYLVAPSDGYAIFTFNTGNAYGLYKMVVKTDNTLSEVGIPADSKAVGDANKRKQAVFFAYCTNDYHWDISGITCNLTIDGTIRVRFDTTDASVDTSKETFISIAQGSGIVTVSDGVVSGTHFAVVFDFGDNTIKILDTAARQAYINTAILFFWHYGILGGELVNNKTALNAAANAEDIAEIKSQIVNTLPTYLENEAQTCKNELISACGEKAFVVAFTTDNHYGASNGMNFPTTVETIERVNELYQFDLVVNGGDIINGDETKTNAIDRLTSAVSMLIETGRPAYTLLGNHDDDSFTSSELPLLSKAELYAMMYRHSGINLDYVAEDEQYGYKDFNQYGLRVIFLDALQGANGHSNADWGYSDAELAWFASDALNTQNQVVIFSHMGFTKEYSAYNYQVKNGAEMRQAVESFIANGGICAGLFHGHTHWDYIGQYSQTNGFKEVSTGCGRMQSGYPSGSYIPEGATAQSREANTVTQELWDIIVIKPESRSVNMIRFGAGNNRNFTY